MAQLDGFAVQVLGPNHDRSTFSSGVDVMDRYLREQAGQDQKRRASVIYVMTPRDSSRVVGYYALSALSLGLGDWPEAVRKRLPRYPVIPVTLMGRLAVDKASRQPGLGLGTFLLVDAFERALAASHQVASFAVVADVLKVEPDPMGFYLRYGFQPLPDHPRRLFLPMQTILETLQFGQAAR